MSTISAIKARLAEIEVERQKLDAEIEELQVAIRVIARLGDSRQLDETHIRRAPRSGTTRDLFTTVLRDDEQVWFTANQVQKKASALKGEEIPMGTTSPTLTAMKADGLLIRRGMLVAWAERIQQIKEASAPGAAAEASHGSDTGLETLFRETADHDR